MTLSIPGAGLTAELGPSVGLRGWVGGRPGLLAREGVQASSMILADWQPLDSGFRVSGGLAYGPLWSVEAGRQFDHSLGDPWTASAGIDPRRWVAQASPYVGLGWGLGTNGRKGPYLSADLGLVYYRNSLATWGCPAGMPSPACTPDLRAGDSAASVEQSRLAPVMSLGVGLRF